MLLYISLAGLLSIFYVFIILRYIEGWNALPDWEIPDEFRAKTSLSILIPARNEAKNILACIESILQQSYPTELVEIIVLDDHSEDNTAELVSQQEAKNIHLIRLSEQLSEIHTQSYKKKALELGIAQAKGKLIVTTDADCIVQKNWLALIVSYYQHKPIKFIAAPVNFHQEKNILESFQSLDFMGMMGITGAGIHRGFMHMCNGANLAYERSAFYAVEGFTGIDQLASGDDMLLMQKIAEKYPTQIGFVKNQEATVFTSAKPDWKSFIQQRLRWASKSASYQEKQVTLILALVFLFCCSMVISALLIPVWGIPLLWVFLGQLAIKTITDYFFLKQMAQYFGRVDLMKHFFSAQFIHIGYIVIIGFLANMKKEYQWKGRKVR